MRKILEKYYGKEVYIVGYPEEYDDERDYIALVPIFVLDDNHAFYIDHIWCKNSKTIKPQPAIYKGIIKWYVKKDGSEDYVVDDLEFVQLNPFKSLDGVKEDMPLMHNYSAIQHVIEPSKPHISKINQDIIRRFESGAIGSTSNVTNLNPVCVKGNSWIAEKHKDDNMTPKEKLRAVLKHVPLTKLHVNNQSRYINLQLDMWNFVADGRKPDDAQKCFVLFAAVTDTHYHWCEGIYDKDNNVFHLLGIDGLECISYDDVHAWQYVYLTSFSTEKVVPAGQVKAMNLERLNVLKTSMINYKKACLFHDRRVHDFGSVLVQQVLGDNAYGTYLERSDKDKNATEANAYNECLKQMKSLLKQKRTEVNVLGEAINTIDQLDLEDEMLNDKVDAFVTLCNVILPNHDKALSQMSDKEIARLADLYDIAHGTSYCDILIRNDVIRRDGKQAIKRYITNDTTVIEEAIDHLKKRTM